MADQIGKATPGPWMAEIEADDPSASIVIEKDGAQIGVVYNSEDFPCIDEDDVERVQGECIANAHLIAAAPDLRVFAEQMRDRHRPHGERQRCLTCGLDGNCCGTYHAAVAVLAKAEGLTP